MIVGLSWAELQAARHWGSERHRLYLSEHRARSPKGGHFVAMPAIGWRTLADRLMREAFHPSGRHRKTRNARDGVAATRQAAQKIERSLAALVTHPAMQGQAQRGNSNEVLYAWRMPSGRMSPFPVRDVLPAFLVPYTDEVSGVGTVTVWRRRDELAVEIPELFADPTLHEGWD
jgi:hypothetical protein